YIKPCPDIGQLGEMVFGSVAMSYRGTSLKIHSLASPRRLMCSQIFPSPRHPSRGCSSAPSQSYARSSVTSSQSLEQSIRLDDSGASSANSISDRLSVHSTGSDTLLVCRGSSSIPLDVPAANSSVLIGSNNLTPSVIGDSGFSGEQSYNSIGSGPQSLPLSCTLNEGEQSFSCGSLYKRWLRSASTSLDHSSSSLTGSASADECLIKPHSRSSKLGLAIIIELPHGQEQLLEQFIMEHAALVESMVWRTRQGAEIAYIRHNSFVSLMYEVATGTMQWLVDLLSGPQLATHMWISIAPVCDKFNSIINSDNIKNNNEKCSNFSYSNSSYTSGNQSDAYRTMSLNDLEEKCSDSEKIFTNSSSSVSLNNSLRSDVTSSYDSSDTLDKSNDFTFLNLTKFLKNEWACVSSKNSYSCSDKNIMAEKCVTELCELLECIDVKHTNFFISTLVTAVLTYHLGWVTTVLPPSSSDKEKVSKLHNPCNPLWGQLTDLYGAIGHPTKVAHTIITGTNKAELISKLLNSLTYFIRCSDTERKCVTRLDMKEENRKVDIICQQKSCIPKENFKKYEDHLREMDVCNSEFLFKKCDKKTSGENKKDSVENIEMHSLSNVQNKLEKKELIKTSDLNLLKENKVESKTKMLGLSKTHSCLSGLNDLTEKDDNAFAKRLYPNLEHLNLNEDAAINEVKLETTTDNNNKEILVPDESDSSYNNSSSNHILLNKVKSLGIQAVESFSPQNTKEFELSNTVINEKVRRLCRVPASAVLYHMESNKEQQQLIDIEEASKQIMKVFAPKKINMEKQMKSADSSFHLSNLSKAVQASIANTDAKESDKQETEHKNVIFVLGDDEELVGLKKDNKNDLQIYLNSNRNQTNLIPSDSQKLLEKNNSCGVLPSSSESTPTNEELKKSETFSDNYELQKQRQNKPIRPTFLNLGLNKSKSTFFNVSSSNSSEMLEKQDDFFKDSKFKDSDFFKCEDSSNIKPSTSCTSLDVCKKVVTNHSTVITLESELDPNEKDIQPKELNRSQSVPPENKKSNTETTKEEVKSKFRYSGVKFNFQQYPQIVTNYMRSKNLELSQLPFVEKAMKLNTLSDYPSFEFLKCDTQLEEVETLQTPSNASELEFTSDLATDNYEMQHAKEKIERKPKTFTRTHLPNTVIKEADVNDDCISLLKKTSVSEHPLKISDKSNNAMFEQEESNSSEDDCIADSKPQPSKMQIIELPMPKSQPIPLETMPINYTSSLMRGIGERYISDMVLQGTSAPKSEWESALRRDLSLATRHPLLDQPVDEAVAIVANTDTWEVQLLSSHTYVVDRGSSGVRVGMSQLVANMLETLLHMWKLHTPPEYCVMHIEQRLQEFCTLSKSLSELLLATEFCSMDLLTSVLQLEVNDVPLLMAVASTHSPQVTQKYGLSFQ
ncbi:hypothetical protein ILUMI_11914, partial [Ignelater luminosus]